MMKGSKGWRHEPTRHGLAAKGIKTKGLASKLVIIDDKKRSEYIDAASEILGETESDYLTEYGRPGEQYLLHDKIEWGDVEALAAYIADQKKGKSLTADDWSGMSPDGTSIQEKAWSIVKSRYNRRVNRAAEDLFNSFKKSGLLEDRSEYDVADLKSTYNLTDDAANQLFKKIQKWRAEED